MAKSPAALLIDAAGNYVQIIDIGGTYYLSTEVKRLVDALPAGTNILGKIGVDPANTGGLALETTLQSADGTLTTIDAVLDAIKDVDGIKKITDALPAGTNILGKIGVDPANTGGLALETTLQDADAKLATIDAVLDAIKDTDGIKKITDALPVGDNRIGRIKITDDIQVLTVPLDGDSMASGSGLGVMGKTDTDAARFLLVDDVGRLATTPTPPTAPPGTTPYLVSVNEAELEVGSGGDVSSPHYTLGSIVPSGDHVYIQVIEAGTEGDSSENGSVVETYWREGATPTDHLIERLYIMGETVQIVLPDVGVARDGTAFAGDGVTTRIVVKRRRLSQAGLEIDFIVRGYTE